HQKQACAEFRKSGKVVPYTVTTDALSILTVETCAHEKALASKFRHLRAQFKAAKEHSSGFTDIFEGWRDYYHLVFKYDELKALQLQKDMLLGITSNGSAAEEEIQEQILSTNFIAINLLTLPLISGLSDIDSESESDDEDIVLLTSHHHRMTGKHTEGWVILLR
ncbi:unnamed protein product, partial [Ceratitis capitata]